jgi:hypothetical protein
MTLSDFHNNNDDINILPSCDIDFDNRQVSDICINVDIMKPCSDFNTQTEFVKNKSSQTNNIISNIYTSATSATAGSDNDDDVMKKLFPLLLSMLKTLENDNPIIGIDYQHRKSKYDDHDDHDDDNITELLNVSILIFCLFFQSVRFLNLPPLLLQSDDSRISSHVSCIDYNCNGSLLAAAFSSTVYFDNADRKNHFSVSHVPRVYNRICVCNINHQQEQKNENILDNDVAWFDVDISISTISFHPTITTLFVVGDICGNITLMV